MIGAIIEHECHGLGVVLKSEINDKSGDRFLFVRWNEALTWDGEVCHHCWIDDEDIKVLTERKCK